ncbi:MAG TPA: hypothetical protein VLN59_11195, partial [Burkholderiales bacterium]|nr:hypothetical protein [Burkholderiales bacterium]
MDKSASFDYYHGITGAGSPAANQRMDKQTIYTKTAKSILEIRNKALRLSQDLAPVLLAVDGKADGGAIAAKFGLSERQAEQALDQLLNGGYIKPVIPATGTVQSNNGPKDDLDLDFTSSATIAQLNAEAAARARQAAAAQARAVDAARSTAEARARQESIAQARLAAEAQARNEGRARAQAEAAAEAAMTARRVAEAEARSA